MYGGLFGSPRLASLVGSSGSAVCVRHKGQGNGHNGFPIIIKRDRTILCSFWPVVACFLSLIEMRRRVPSGFVPVVSCGGAVGSSVSVVRHHHEQYGQGIKRDRTLLLFAFDCVVYPCEQDVKVAEEDSVFSHCH